MIFTAKGKAPKALFAAVFVIISLNLLYFLGWHNVRHAGTQPPPPSEEKPPVEKVENTNECSVPDDLLRYFDSAFDLDEAADHDDQTGSSSEDDDNGLLRSPFASTLAMIKWNSPHAERIPLLLKYAPFFDTVHLSMPGLLPPDLPGDFHNLTHDQYGDSDHAYVSVARTMQRILDSGRPITGLLFFHFDAWIDPLGWFDEDRERIWFPASMNTRNHGTDEGPLFSCMTSKSSFDGWHWWQQDTDKKAVAALQDLRRIAAVEGEATAGAKTTRAPPPTYSLPDYDEFCVGWSDIYYVPRVYFADFIYLSHLFACEGVFHESAVPTMLHVIDRSRRENPYHSIIRRIGDCWGSCCDSSATPDDVRWTRCGHRLDYQKQDVVDAHYLRLEREAAALGRPVSGLEVL